jgi:hypothetical protein
MRATCSSQNRVILQVKGNSNRSQSKSAQIVRHLALFTIHLPKFMLVQFKRGAIVKVKNFDQGYCKQSAS